MHRTPPIKQVLTHRPWWRRSYPFPHIVAHDVFTENFYAQLCDAFNEILSLGFRDRQEGGRLSRSMLGYDAYGLTFSTDYSGPFSLFMSREWHDLLAGLFKAKCTGHVSCGIHHHVTGSAHGWVHNDLNPAYFVDYPSDDGINLVRHDVCNYVHGNGSWVDVKPRVVIRSVAMMFYLCNAPWSPGDGGTTGLYLCKDDAVTKPAVVVPPFNNSLLLFECTPYSYHSFITNRRSPRNSVIMWLHREKACVLAQWGEGKIVEWRTRKN